MSMKETYVVLLFKYCIFGDAHFYSRFSVLLAKILVLTKRLSRSYINSVHSPAASPTGLQICWVLEQGEM